MALKILERLKARESAKPDTSALEAAQKSADAKVAAAQRAGDLRAAKAEAAAKAAEEKAKAAEERATKVALERQDSERDAVLQNELARARVMNPAHGVALLRSRLVVTDGKIVSKDDPTKGPADVVAAFLADEGRYMLPAAVPGGGAGAPANPVPPKAATPHDMTTSAGLTARAREITHLASQPRTTQPAPGTPGASGLPPVGQA